MTNKLRKSLFYIIGSLLICSFAVNLVQLRRTQSNDNNTLDAVMVNFAAPIDTATEGFKLKTPLETRMGKISLVSQSVGALRSGITTLDGMGIPHQYSYDILMTNQSAIGALEGGYPPMVKKELVQWLNTEGTLLRKYELQRKLPNVTLLRQTFKAIYNAIPLSKSSL
ncbi:hypothetical protein [Alicyclobacillus fodiniaquatilis]|uniref:Uncharacterized protein n=1 Tax=Alicyclobacillus fodiniaquatilis TaxID=1661150 RepID=A0ABW4JPI4_9BACL